MDLEMIAQMLTRAQEEQSARVIQNFWRTILIARRWSKMRRGFRLFQVFIDCGPLPIIDIYKNAEKLVGLYSLAGAKST